MAWIRIDEHTFPDPVFRKIVEVILLDYKKKLEGPNAILRNRAKTNDYSKAILLGMTSDQDIQIVSRNDQSYVCVRGSVIDDITTLHIGIGRSQYQYEYTNHVTAEGHSRDFYLPSKVSKITSLQGIECFTGLKKLILSNVEIERLDLTRNIYLKELKFQDTDIKTLILDKNKNDWIETMEGISQDNISWGIRKQLALFPMKRYSDEVYHPLFVVQGMWTAFFIALTLSCILLMMCIKS